MASTEHSLSAGSGSPAAAPAASRGRGAVTNVRRRFQQDDREIVHDGWQEGLVDLDAAYPEDGHSLATPEAAAAGVRAGRSRPAASVPEYRPAAAGVRDADACAEVRGDADDSVPEYFDHADAGYRRERFDDAYDPADFRQADPDELEAVALREDGSDIGVDLSPDDGETTVRIEADPVATDDYDLAVDEDYSDIDEGGRGRPAGAAGVAGVARSRGAAAAVSSSARSGFWDRVSASGASAAAVPRKAWAGQGASRLSGHDPDLDQDALHDDTLHDHLQDRSHERGAVAASHRRVPAAEAAPARAALELRAARTTVVYPMAYPPAPARFGGQASLSALVMHDAAHDGADAGAGSPSGAPRAAGQGADADPAGADTSPYTGADAGAARALALALQAAAAQAAFDAAQAAKAVQRSQAAQVAQAAAGDAAHASAPDGLSGPAPRAGAGDDHGDAAEDDGGDAAPADTALAVPRGLSAEFAPVVFHPRRGVLPGSVAPVAPSRHDAAALRGGVPPAASILPTGGALKTTVKAEQARKLLSRNDSPDIPFDQAVNPYRGCEHGCVYCYARPTHAYLGYSPGLDFETRLIAKANAVEALRAELARPGYVVSPINIGSATDVYQPIERTWKLTRGLLELMDETGHPATLVTKNALVERDLDILQRLAARNLITVYISITTLDTAMSRTLEPRASAPWRRIQAVRTLARAGIPVGVLVAPLIPFINDDALEHVIEHAAAAGARSASYTVVRLPWEVKDVFETWLHTHFPDRAQRVLHRIEDLRQGRLNDPDFGTRMRGTGVWADLLKQRFQVALRRFSIRNERHTLSCEHFVAPQLAPRVSRREAAERARREGQMDLF